MEKPVLIRTSGLWKRYGTTIRAEMKNFLPFVRKHETDPTVEPGPWALKDVDIEVKKGDTLGVIGRNGSGKSTLLKLLAGVTPPSCGDLEIKGSIFPMIELNSGLHVDLTGRQNVFLLGAVMGMLPGTVEERLDDIEAFCELGEWFDRPVWMYSSGMVARLGFSVAVNVSADILLIDEVLSVGDLSFQRKCYKRIEQLRKEGVTTVFVSHSIRQVERLCSEVILLEHGEITMRGNPAKVCHHYMQIETEDSMKKMGLRLDNNISEATWQGSGEVLITKVETFTDSGEECKDFHTCDSMKIRVSYEAHREIKAPIIGIAIYTSDMLVLAAFSNEKASLDMVMDGKGNFECTIPSLPVLPGLYSIGVSVKGRDSSLIYKGIHLTSFKMQYTARSKQSRGLMHLEPDWNFVSRHVEEQNVPTRQS